MTREVNEDELAFVRAFILPAKRERYLSLLPNPKHRPKVLSRLNHLLDLEWSFATSVNDNSARSVAALLKSMGAKPTCHVIADACKFDGYDMPLENALNKSFLHQFGVILCCVRGRLAYYKPESPGPKYLLENPVPNRS
jgi:hypothetical protein